MKECPKCKNLFSEEEENCPACSCKESEPQQINDEEWLHLTTVANDIEFGMVAGLLEMGNIPTLRKTKGVDGYLQIILGVPLGGIQVMVPKDKYEEALQLINTSVDDAALEEEEKGTE